MNTKLSTIRCFICYCKFEEETNLDENEAFSSASSSSLPFKDRINDEELLRKQLLTIFLLKKLFNIPNETCCHFLQKYGNPSSWVYWCDSCGILVDEAKMLFSQIKLLERKIDRVQKKLSNKITSSGKWENYSSEAETTNNEPSEVVRNLIIQNVQSSSELEVKTEINLDFSMENESNSSSPGDIFGDRESMESFDAMDDMVTVENKFPNLENAAPPSKSSNGVKKSNTKEVDGQKIKIDEEEVKGKRRLKKKGNLASSNEKSLYNCQHCDEEFKNYEELKTHKKQHKKNYPCQYCSRTFSRDWRLRDHLLSHADPSGKPFKCSTCDKAFSYRYGLRNHEIIHKEGNPFECTVCGLQLSTSQSLARHQEMHSGKVKERPFLCVTCGKAFPSVRELKLHEKYHSKERPHICHICGKGFVVKKHLIDHFKSHSDEKPFSCTFCDEKFKWKLGLTKHLRMHTNEPGQHKCSNCDKSFEQLSHLKKHEMTHTGEKPFLCTICGLRFTSPSSVSRHVHVVHDKVPGKFLCLICDKRFHGSVDLKRHGKMHKEVN